MRTSAVSNPAPVPDGARAGRCRPPGGVGWCCAVGAVAGLLWAGAGCAPTASSGQAWSPESAARLTNAPAVGPVRATQPPKKAPPAPKPVSMATQPAGETVLPRYPLVTAVERSVGRVATVNTQAQFVVVDFGFSPVPRSDQRLTVFRTNEPVGTLRMTGLPRSGLMAADIMSGEARVGDEVRDE